MVSLMSSERAWKTMPVCWRTCAGSFATLKPRMVAVPPDGNHQGGEDAEERGLAGAVGAEQAEDLRGRDGEGEMVERDAGAVVVGERREHDGIVGVRGRRDGDGAGLKSGGGHRNDYLLPAVASSIMMMSNSGRYRTLALSSARA